ncbi:MAG: hypothetical protein QOH25_2210 [Acidobacteriota bacterium]|nr:hypothetical protein [Acidobacteriota bacterium]
MPLRMILLSISLLMLTIPLSAIPAREAKDSAMTPLPADAKSVFRPVIEFGHEGGNLRPYKIGIDASGRVRVLAGRPQLKVERIAAEKVRELVSLASNKGFWESSAADDMEAQKVPPDFGFVFVRLRAATRRVIYHHGRQAGALGRFYTQLSDLVLVQP